MGYGTAFLPSTPGQFEIEVVTWSPEGDSAERLKSEPPAPRVRLRRRPRPLAPPGPAAFFTGDRLTLANPEIVTSSVSRPGFAVDTAGSVHLSLSVVVRGFDELGGRVQGEVPADEGQLEAFLA